MHAEEPRRPTRGTIGAYYAATRALDTESWVATFATDAATFQPAWAEPAEGHHALRELFWDLSSAFDHSGLTEGDMVFAGNRAAVSWSGHRAGRSGGRVRFTGLDVFEFDDHGRIRTLWSHWDAADGEPEAPVEHG